MILRLHVGLRPRTRVGSRLHARLRSRAGLHARIQGDAGQATVEYALVAFAFMAIAAALAALWHALQGSMFVDHALQVASHHLQLVAPVTMVDIFLY